MSDSVRCRRRQPTSLRCPWDSPGKNTGVCCHFLLQGMNVKRDSAVAQSCPTLSNPMDCSLPGSSNHGIFQARVLECGATAFSSPESCSRFKEGWKWKEGRKWLPGRQLTGFSGVSEIFWLNPVIAQVSFLCIMFFYSLVAVWYIFVNVYESSEYSSWLPIKPWKSVILGAKLLPFILGIFV